MQLRLMSRIIAYGMLAYLLGLPGVWILSMILVNVLPIPSPHFILTLVIPYVILRFGLFGVVGLKVGERAAERKIANALLAGVLLTVGVMTLDTLAVNLLPKGQPRPGMPRGPQMSMLAEWALYLGMIGLQIALAAAGGWIAARRTSDQVGADLRSGVA